MLKIRQNSSRMAGHLTFGNFWLLLSSESDEEILGRNDKKISLTSRNFWLAFLTDPDRS